MKLFLGLALSMAMAVAGTAIPAETGTAKQTAFTVKVTGTGSPMILIPGLSSSGEVWNETVARFQDRYECHVLTLAGFAGVPPQPGLTLETVRRQVAAYIRSNELKKPVIVGHSLGGFLAMWLAIEEPAVVGRLVIVDSLPFLPAAWMPGATVEGVKVQAEGMKAMMDGMKPEAWEKYQRSNPALTTMITSADDIARVTEWGVKSDPRMVAQGMYDLFVTDLREKVGNIQAPGLVMAALKGYPEGAFEMYRGQYSPWKSAKLVPFPGARHFIMYDDRGTMLKAMEEFLGTAK